MDPKENVEPKETKDQNRLSLTFTVVSYISNYIEFYSDSKVIRLSKRGALKLAKALEQYLPFIKSYVSERCGQDGAPVNSCQRNLEFVFQVIELQKPNVLYLIADENKLGEGYIWLKLYENKPPNQNWAPVNVYAKFCLEKDNFEDLISFIKLKCQTNTKQDTIH